jgi:hypothetical protein
VRASTQPRRGDNVDGAHKHPSRAAAPFALAVRLSAGLGSSYFFDALVRGCCCLPLPEKEREKRARAAQHSEDHAVHNVSASARRREAYLMRHLGNDFLAGNRLSALASTGARVRCCCRRVAAGAARRRRGCRDVV